jgi:hypothetical protein
MSFSPALCPACNRELPIDFINRPAPDSCPSCHRKIQTMVFPASFRQPDHQPSKNTKKEGEAGCFYHPEKPAVAVCDFCGVFLSDLCDLQINGKHICPPCFGKAENKAKLLQFDRSRTLFDGIAIALAVVPFIAFLIISPFLFLTFFTSLSAIFVALRYWKSPGSVVPRSRVRYILAIIFALLQVFGWIALVVFVSSMFWDRS